jgi:NitT/TauT family transport system permease protein
MPTLSSRLIEHALTVLLYLVILAAWEILTMTFRVPVWILPAPSAILQAAVKWAPELAQNSWVTLRETIGGFLLAIVLSLPMAILISLNALARKLIYPILLSLQSVPKVAVAPLIILWFGLSEWPKIVVVVLVCFFPILVNIVAGLEAMPKTMLDLMRSLGAHPHMWYFAGCGCPSRCRISLPAARSL